MDITHYYIEQGRGNPLILLHGNGESCDYFVHQIEAFSKLYHVYAPAISWPGKIRSRSMKLS